MRSLLPLWLFPFLLVACTKAPPTAPQTTPPSHGAVTTAPAPSAAARASVTPKPRPTAKTLWRTGGLALEVRSTDSGLRLRTNQCTIDDVDANTGAILRSIPVPKDPYGHCSGCSLFDDVYVCSGDPNLSVYSIADNKRRFSRRSPDSNFSFEPDRGYLLEKRAVVALDPHKGKELWRMPVDGQGTIVHSDSDGVIVQVAGSGSTAVIALAAADGSVRWQHQLDELATVSPVEPDRIVIAGTSITSYDRRSGRALSEFPSPGPTYRGKKHVDVYAAGEELLLRYEIDIGKARPPIQRVQLVDRSGRERWHRDVPFSSLYGVAAGRALLSADVQPESLYAIDLETGEVAWRVSIPYFSVHFPRPNLALITHTEGTSALDLRTDLPQQSGELRGHVAIASQSVSNVRVRVGELTIVPDAHGNFAAPIRGLGTFWVRVEFNRQPSNDDRCPESTGAKFDPETPQPISLNVTDRKCSVFMHEVRQ